VRKHYDSGNMQRLQGKYTAEDIVWLSIDSSADGNQGYLTPESAKQFMKTGTRPITPSGVVMDGDMG